MTANKGYLAGKTLFITGASRGIGREIALRAARDGAKVVIAAKTKLPHPKLKGTIFTVAKEVEEAGGKALPCVVDIRSEDQVQRAVSSAVAEFGGIDILVNNASAISLTNTENTPMKRFDLMMGINTRGTYLCSKTCLPHLKDGKNPHILNIAPPLNMKPVWFKNHVAYTMAKYGMSLCVLGMAEEFREHGIAVNALWPRTAIMTAAMEMLGGPDIAAQCRLPTIMADAAYELLGSQNLSKTGKFLIDEDVLKETGITDMEQYACVPGSTLLPDFFLDEADPDVVLQAEQTVAAIDSIDLAAAVKKVFEHMGNLVEETTVNKIGHTFIFELADGPDDVKGDWFIDLKNGEGAVFRGTGEADCRLKMTCDLLLKIASAEINTSQAFLEGKLKISGDTMAALKLEGLIKKLRPKL